MNRQVTRASLAAMIALIAAGPTAAQKPVSTSQVITDYIDPHFAPFQAGEQYLLLLQWNPHLSKYQVRWGPDGAFHISAGVVEAMGHGAVAKQLHGHRVDEVLQTMRAISSGG